MISVMIVDDDYLVIEELKAIVNWEALGYRIVATAKNGVQAYKRYLEYKPKVVISDASMPGMDGLDLLEKIREQNSQTFVVIISSYADFQYAKRALRNGAFDYIMKEELTEELLGEKLRNIAERILSSQWNENRIVRTLLSDFFSSTDTPEYFLQKSMAGGKTLWDIEHYLKQKRLYFLFVFKRGLTYKPQRDDIYVENGRKLLLALAQTNLKELSNPVMFYLDWGLVVGFDIAAKTAPLMATRLGKELGSRLEVRTGRKVLGFYSGKQEQLVTFRDLTVGAQKNILFSTVFSKKTLIDLNSLETPVIKSKQDTFEYSLIEKSWNNPKIYYEKLHGFLSSLFMSCDVDRIVVLYQNILGQYEYLGSPMEFENLQFFSGQEDLEEFLRTEYEKAKEEIERVNTAVYSNSVQKIIKYISEEFRNPDLSVEKIAEHVGLSAGRISVLFRKETGKTINDYLTEVRMEQAIYLLTNTNLKIYEVANSCGYRSAQYFTRVFNSKSGKRLVDYK